MAALKQLYAQEAVAELRRQETVCQALVSNLESILHAQILKSSKSESIRTGLQRQLYSFQAESRQKGIVFGFRSARKRTRQHNQKVTGMQKDLELAKSKIHMSFQVQQTQLQKAKT